MNDCEQKKLNAIPPTQSKADVCGVRSPGSSEPATFNAQKKLNQPNYELEK